MSAHDLLQMSINRRVPDLRQAEASECGLTCLAMVAGFYGLHVGMPIFRSRFGSSARGVTLRRIIDIANAIGLDARAIRLDLSDIRGLTLPAILHWNLNHFVVLTKISNLRGRRYRIHDPASGPRTINEEEISRCFTGVALEIRKTSSFVAQSDRPKLRLGQLWSGIHGASSAVLGVIGLSAILQIISLALPFYLQTAIDTALPAGDNQLLNMLAIGFGGIIIIEVFTSWLRTTSLVNLSGSFSFQITNNLFRHLISLPQQWFERRHVGDVISRFQSGDPITEFVSQGMISAVLDGVMAFITLLLMYSYSGVLASIALGAWLIYTATRILSFAAMKQSNVSAIAANAAENSHFIETIRGIGTIKAFGREANRQHRWLSTKAAAVNAHLRTGRINAHFDAASSLVLALERMLFVYLAVRSAMVGGFTVGMIFAFQAYKAQFLDAATRLVDLGVKYRLMDLHLSRISDIALTRREINLRLTDEFSSFRGEIELRNVSFRYGAGDPFILKNVSFRINAGDLVAFVGPSGGGKSTLLKILLGLVEPVNGTVLVDGLPLSQVGVQTWRTQTGSVLQEDRLFAGTLAENISFFDPETDIDAVRRACRGAAVLDEIDAMPLGFETLVGDMGSALSGGQRQRVMLARALYAKPRVLIMDEGTANLDPMAEESIVETIRSLSITRLVSTHRPAPAHGANQVYLVKDGNVTPLQPIPMSE